MFAEAVVGGLDGEGGEEGGTEKGEDDGVI